MRNPSSSPLNNLSSEQRAKLKERLEALYKLYSGKFLHTDPISLAHEYKSPQDIEIVALITSSLTYGNVKQIQQSVRRVLDFLGKNPRQVICNATPRGLSEALNGFKHRFTSGRDVACLLYLIQQALSKYGSLKKLFMLGYSEDEEHIGPAMVRFVDNLLSLDCSPYYREGALPSDAGVRYIVPSPRMGSACKRLNLYLRWMVRRNDGVDFGLWEMVSTAKLIIPLDTHVARISRHLGLTSLRAANWKMALEVTKSLRELDAHDPVKYDFALCRLGILDLCPKKIDPSLCTECQLNDICQLRR